MGYQLRETPQLYQCLSTVMFDRLPLPNIEISSDTITVHFWITGRMKETLPRDLNHIEAKVYKMVQRGLWAPRHHEEAERCIGGISDPSGLTCCAKSCGTC